MYDICYGGRRASEFGVCISDRPDIPAAKKKMESIEIGEETGCSTWRKRPMKNLKLKFR